MIHAKLRAPGLMIAMAVAALACGKNKPPAEEPGAGERTVLVSEPVPSAMVEPMVPLPMEAPAEPMFACVSDRDCMLVEMGCCDHCNGGSLMSVNVDHVGHAVQSWHEPSCGAAMCTKMACVADPPRPVCDGGVCARRVETEGDDGQLEVSIIRNVLPTR